MLTESQRKWLTEYIGECWHTLTAFLDNGIIECSCGARMSRGPDEATFHVEQENNRTFTTWADLGAVMEKIVERGEWGHFYSAIMRQWYLDDGSDIKSDETDDAAFARWLINPSRFCELVCRWRGWSDG